MVKINLEGRFYFLKIIKEIIKILLHIIDFISYIYHYGKISSGNKFDFFNNFKYLQLSYHCHSVTKSKMTIHKGMCTKIVVGKKCSMENTPTEVLLPKLENHQ